MLVGDSPKLAREELSIAGEERWRARGLIHVERFTIRIARAGRYVMKFEIGKSWHPDDTIHGLQTRLRQFITCKINRQRGCVSDTKVSRRIVGVGLCVNPTLFVEWKRRNVALSASYRHKAAFSNLDGSPDFRVVRNDTTGNRHRCLEESNRGYIRSREFIYEAVAVGIHTQSKTLF